MYMVELYCRIITTSADFKMMHYYCKLFPWGCCNIFPFYCGNTMIISVPAFPITVPVCDILVLIVNFACIYIDSLLYYRNLKQQC